MNIVTILPKEIWAEIFKYLNNEYVFSIPYVCKYWLSARHLSEKLHKRVKVLWIAAKKLDCVGKLRTYAVHDIILDGITILSQKTNDFSALDMTYTDMYDIDTRTKISWEAYGKCRPAANKIDSFKKYIINNMSAVRIIMTGRTINIHHNTNYYIKGKGGRWLDNYSGEVNIAGITNYLRGDTMNITECIKSLTVLNRDFR